MTQASFALAGHNPDVLTCIANLSNDEVFTPPELANQMLDKLEQSWSRTNGGEDIWGNKAVTFLDPCTKSGVFLREIVRRLNNGLIKEIPDLTERINHILTKQVFGIGITELTSLIARRSVYCSKNANGIHSIARTFSTDAGNIWFKRTEHSWVSGKCKFCGASEAEYGRGDLYETHAYKFIHSPTIEEDFKELFGGTMQFDVIIGNPPYQLSAGETSDSPIYHHFVEQGMALEPRSLVMVTPSRWFTGGKGLDEYRKRMIADRRLETIVDFPHSFETFPGVEIKGGVSFFLWNRDYEGDCEFVTYLGGKEVSRARRDLREGAGVVIRDNRASTIVKKVISQGGPFLSERVSPQTPFGIYTNFADWHPKKRAGDVQLFKRGLEEAWIDPKHVSTRHEWIPKIKVIMSYAYNGGDSLPHQIIGKPLVIPGNSVVTQTFMVAGVFETKKEAENYAEFLRTRFVRFLIRQRKISQHNRPDTFAFVPDLPMNQRWTDALLSEKFGLSQQEQEYIASVVKPMVLGADVGDDG